MGRYFHDSYCESKFYFVIIVTPNWFYEFPTRPVSILLDDLPWRKENHAPSVRYADRTDIQIYAKRT